MLANGRQSMVERSIRGFQDQTYQNKRLLIYDTTSESEHLAPVSDESIAVQFEPANNRSIGELRNAANATAVSWLNADILCHMDSDDLSMPDRLTDQVALLEASGAEVVGYHEMLFWKTRKLGLSEIPGSALNDGCTEMIEEEAWLYSSQNPSTCLGTSLLYRRATWERKPFPHKHTGEDTAWLLGLKTTATSAGVQQPKMIASIHSSNTCAKIIPGAREWKRAAYADAMVRERMAL
jgi:hypothetical protein